MNELEELFIDSGWFKFGKTRQETVKQFEKHGYSEYDIYGTILDMNSRKILYSYPSKEGLCYRLLVQPDIELDIGV